MENINKTLELFKQWRADTLDGSAETIRKVETYFENVELQLTGQMLLLTAEANTAGLASVEDEITDRMTESLADMRTAKEHLAMSLFYVAKAMSQGKASEIINLRVNK